ncbi:MAG: Txe/YoeB family addiction module toxin [bacterium]|nr:Txe/YoeB family addiction module toxin [bacterium]
MTTIAFHQRAFEDFTQWEKVDKKIYRRIVALIADVLRHPFSGIGKPEPLKHELSGCWSRRISKEHRLVYKVDQDTVVIISCRFHYQD